MLKRVKRYLLQQYQSLIFRILLYFGISGLAVAIILGWNFANRIKPHFEHEILPNLSQYLLYLVRDIGTPPDLEKANALAAKLAFKLRIDGDGIDWSSTKDLRPIDDYHFKSARYPDQHYAINRRDSNHKLLFKAGGYRYLFVFDNSFRHQVWDRHWLLFGLLAGILIILYLMIRRLFNPVHDISHHLQKVSAGQFDQSIKTKGKGELVQLAQGINRMTVEISNMLKGKAGLLLAISHELRSPMTRMRINLELLDDDRQRQVLVQDLKEMETLLSNIIESERLNTRHASLHRSYFNMAELVNQIIEQNFKSRIIRKKLSTSPVHFDELRIRLMVKNLIENACRYSHDSNQAVEVELDWQADFLIFQVIDHGPGVSAIELSQLTEAFYRTDTARQRKTGGYGLGLYLCRLIVEAHEGNLTLQSKQGQGMTATVRIPLKQNS